MALLTYNLNIDAGATYPQADGPLAFEWTDEAGNLQDLTGYTASLQIRQAASSSTVAATVTPTIDVPTAQVRVTIPASVTSTLTSGPYVYALELRAAGGEPVVRFVEGRVFVSAEVVR